MIRLFVGLELPPSARIRLAAFRGGIPGARWVEPENFHITLRFIGEVDESQATDIDDALMALRAPSFFVELEGAGIFGQGRKARSLWVGVARNPALLHLRDKVESTLVRIGLAPDARKFSPHVTLARLKDAPASRLESFLADRALFRDGPFLVKSFVLFSSLLTQNGAHYTPERVYALDTAPA